MTEREADELLHQELLEVANDPHTPIGVRVFARLVAGGVDWWLARPEGSPARLSELCVYGLHGGHGSTSELPPIDAVDRCFARHNARYDVAAGKIGST